MSSTENPTTTLEPVAGPHFEAAAAAQPAALVRAPRTFTLAPRTIDEAMTYSKIVAASALCPKDFQGRPNDVLIAVQLGMELGVSPIQALQNICVINGRPTMWGDLVLALVMDSGLLTAIDERDPDTAWKEKAGRCEVHRKGFTAPIVRTFTHEQAVSAGLVERSSAKGPWTTYPGRMLQMRARSLALRDAFPDVLKGLHVREEEQDVVIDAQVVPQPIAMPRRISASSAPAESAPAPSAADVDAFLGSSGAAPAGAPNTWRGIVARVDEKAGKTKGGKAWTLFSIVGDDGAEFSTFDTAHRDIAEGRVGQPVEILYKETPGKKPGSLYKTITSIVEGAPPAEQFEREPGEDA